MYLLLRNNKQSGPYSLEDLKSMGLKAYDLVWLEGKSAAWRYPCELPELSAFAPPVEEQPFDRFYKKPVASTTPATEPVVAAVRPVAAEPVAAPTLPLYTGEPSAVPGKRIIYVTMPAGRNASPVREMPREQPAAQAAKEPVRQPVRESVGSIAPDPAHTAYSSGPGYTAGNANPKVEDYSSQLPSLEEQLEAVSPRRKKKESNERIVRPLVIGATVLALLAAGIFIGLSLNKNSNGDHQTMGQTMGARNQARNTDPSLVHPVSQQLPPTSTVPAITAPTTEKPAGFSDSSGIRANRVESLVPPVYRPARTGTPKERSGTQKKGALPLPAVKDSAAGMNSGQAVHRADVAEAKPENKPADRELVKTTINSQVSVGANGYSVGTFGGINDLQLTVTNRSVYPLDLVVVEVQYIQANKKVYKTENLYFRNIGAGSALMQEAPKSSRGIKVQYKIITISSKDLG